MDSIEKKYYKISEVAEILHLPPSTLRFWENRFTIIKPHRNAKGTRFYTASDIETISMIHYLVKQRGFKLDAAQEQIRSNPDGLLDKWRTVARLKSIRERLVMMIDALHSLR